MLPSSALLMADSLPLIMRQEGDKNVDYKMFCNWISLTDWAVKKLLIYSMNYIEHCFSNGTACFKIVNNHLNMSICSYLETSGGQSSHLYFNVVHFSTPV